jgi:CRP-like cAMP-binding protein
MSSKSLWSNIFRQREEQGDITTTLARVPMFKNLSRAELNLVKNLIHLRKYQPEEVIFMEGQPGTGMYLIASGGVDICLNYKRENQIDLVKLKEGDFFGELSLLDESPRSATAIAIGATELAGFFRSDLMDLIEKSPLLGNKIVLALAEVLGERLRATNKELRHLRERVHSVENQGLDKAVEKTLKA